MENRKQRSSRAQDSAADLPRTMAEFLLENPPQASTPDLQAKQERLLRMLAGSSSAAHPVGSTEATPD